MYMPLWIGVLAIVGVPAFAHADHHGMIMGSRQGPESSFGAGISLVAASFSTIDYIGDYQGVVPAVSWSMGRVSVGTQLALYRLEENGREIYGQGDAVVHAQATMFEREAIRGGATLAVSAPTGNQLIGLGMGHAMAMPAAFGLWTCGLVTLGASLGFGRAIAGGTPHHDHGSWPLVEPMNRSEVTWSANGDVAIGYGMRAGARIGGGIPVIDAGRQRVIAAIRMAWSSGRVDTAAELQAGLAGDPFTIRGVVETALRF